VERDARARRPERPPRHPARERRRRVRRPARAPSTPGGSRACADSGAGAGPGACPGPGRSARRVAAPTTGCARSVDGASTGASPDVRARRPGATCGQLGDIRSGQRSDRRELACDVPRPGPRVVDGAWSRHPARAAGAHDLRDERSPPTAARGGRPGREPARHHRSPFCRARRFRPRGCGPRRVGPRRRGESDGNRPGRRLGARQGVARRERLAHTDGIRASVGGRGPRCARPDRANRFGCRRRTSSDPRGGDRDRRSDTRDPRRRPARRPARGGVPPRVPRRSGRSPKSRP
jgi:hypothetical protein